MSGPELITLGCRLNIAESEAMRALVRSEDELIIVNSCAVTNEAVRQTRQAIRRAKRARPSARIVVTGCAAQVDPAMFAAMQEVARVVGNGEKLLADSYHRPFVSSPSTPPAGVAQDKLRLSAEVETRSSRPQRPSTSLGTNGVEVRVGDIFSITQTAPHLVSGFAGHARAFVEVQTGCDHRCTFCIIPYGRGNSRAAPAEQVIERIAALVEQGYREVVLTGVDLTSHPDLAGLVERILKDVPALPRLRLSSLDPSEIGERLFDLITGEPRLMPHLHLSLQAGDDMILKRMKRRHARAQAIALVERVKARRPEVAIGADVIAGFPTETDAMFANSLKLLDDCDVVFGHIFPFSPRDGTPAARMPQLDRAVIRARAKALRERAGERQRAWLTSLIGARQRVLVELDGVSGHAENFARIRVRAVRHASRSTTCPTPTPPLKGRGSIMEVRVTAAETDTLIAEPIE